MNNNFTGREGSQPRVELASFVAENDPTSGAPKPDSLPQAARVSLASMQVDPQNTEWQPDPKLVAMLHQHGFGLITPQQIRQLRQEGTPQENPQPRATGNNSGNQTVMTSAATQQQRGNTAPSHSNNTNVHDDKKPKGSHWAVLAVPAAIVLERKVVGPAAERFLANGVAKNIFKYGHKGGIWGDLIVGGFAGALGYAAYGNFAGAYDKASNYSNILGAGRHAKEGNMREAFASAASLVCSIGAGMAAGAMIGAPCWVTDHGQEFLP